MFFGIAEDSAVLSLHLFHWVQHLQFISQSVMRSDQNHNFTESKVLEMSLLFCKKLSRKCSCCVRGVDTSACKSNCAAFEGVTGPTAVVWGV